MCRPLKTPQLALGINRLLTENNPDDVRSTGGHNGHPCAMAGTTFRRQRLTSSTQPHRSPLLLELFWREPPMRAFRQIRWRARFRRLTPENSKFNVSFKTDSIETLVPVFDEHMKGEKLFDTEKFPEATFKSTKLEKTGEKTGKVTGELTIKGVTKPVTLDVWLNFSGAHPFSKKTTLGFALATKLKRTEFGVSQGAPFVSDEILLEIQTEMNQKSSRPIARDHVTCRPPIF